MDDSRQYRIYPNDLSLRTAYEAVYDHLQRCGYAENKESYCHEIGFTVRLSDERTLRTRTSQEFLELLKQYPAPHSTWTHCHWKKKDTEVKLTIEVRRSGIDTMVSADDLTTVAGLHDKISEIFQARNSPEEKGGVSRYDLKPTVFLAHRFDEQGRSYAETVERFLRRLGFEVLEGEGYEARDIPAKVAERIRSQDIFLCLVSEGDPTWILSEAAFAKGLSKYIVILVQDDLPFKKGIIGTDYEHMTFPKGLIEKTYSDLLYALPKK
jgi:hypothetical protein